MGRLAVINNLRASRGRDRGRSVSTMLDALRRGPGPAGRVYRAVVLADGAEW